MNSESSSPASKRINSIFATRTAASDSLARVLRSLDGTPSEEVLTRRWREMMHCYADIVPDGWYQPPPGGAVALVGKPTSFERLRFESLRNPKSWPDASIAYDREDLLFVYASPIHARTNMIGDFAVTLYRGRDRNIVEAMRIGMHATKSIVAQTRVGMSLGELYERAVTVLGSNGLENLTGSTTHSHGSDIGHTIPWSSGDGFSNRTKSSGGDLARVIANSRTFIHARSQERIAPTTAFTIEPRVTLGGGPPITFHMIVAYLDGARKVETGFGPLFELTGMNDFLRDI